MPTQNSCTLLLKASPDTLDLPECRRSLESGSEPEKLATMRALLTSLASADASSSAAASLVMHVIRFVMPNQKCKMLKKLVLLYFEMVPKVDAEGKLLQEMILLCNALRSDLQHPNEFVRGVTLRFVCKLTEPELLEPLLPVVRSCLEHGHAYVRRNAIFAVWSIWRSQPFMIPDGPELIEQVLAVEGDAGCQRNAFLVLAQSEPARAAAYFDSIASRIEILDSGLQLAMIQFMLGDAASASSPARAKYAQCLGGLLAATSGSIANMVRLEACSALMSLSTSPAAVKSVAGCYVEMIIREADNNAKLILLDRLAALQKQHPAIVNECILDVVRIVGASTGSSEVRKRALEVVLAGLSNRSAPEIALFFRRELARLKATEESDPEQKRDLVNALYTTAKRHGETMAEAVGGWVDFLADPEAKEVPEVLAHLKEAVDMDKTIASQVIPQLANSLESLRDANLIQSVLWILAEYSSDLESILSAAKSALGEIPLVAAEERRIQSDEDQVFDNSNGSGTAKTKVLSDGTYVTESSGAVEGGNKKRCKKVPRPSLLQLFLDGQHAVGASLSLALTKLFLRHASQQENANTCKAEILLIATSIIKFCLSRHPSTPIDQDSYERIMFCIRLLSQPSPSASLVAVLTDKCRQTYEALLASKSNPQKARGNRIGAPIKFRLAQAAETVETLPADMLERDIAKAIEGSSSSATSIKLSALSKVIQLTGHSDPIYAETYVHVAGSDITLDLLLVNQTDRTLENVSLDMAGSASWTIVDRPSPISLAPHSFATAKLSIRVSSTAASAAATLIGALSYGSTDPRAIPLAPIPIDVTDYLLLNPASGNQPALDEPEFRRRWTVLEWENKINISTLHASAAQAKDESLLSSFLERILRPARLLVLTPSNGLVDGGAFLAANMYARSVFGEDVLANICLERLTNPDGSVQVSGHVRLRSKTQGIAVALGDKLSALVQSIKL